MPSSGRPPEQARRCAGEPPLVEVGRIVNRHGVRGEVRLLLHNPASTIVGAVSSIVIRRDDGTHERRRLLGSRRHKRFMLLRFEGTTTADQAEQLIGTSVWIRHDQLPPLGPGEVYHFDLVGCAVRTDAGQELGTVRELIATGSNDVLVVAGHGGEHLIPLVDEVVVHIDAATAEIIVRPLSGLLN